MAGSQGHVAVLADCERALGRPERAIDMYRATSSDQLSEEERVELLIVAAGARVDLKHPEAAVAMLQVRELVATKPEPWLARLRYAYADALLATGRSEEAREWFARAAEVDEEVSTDAAERLLELDGVVLEELEDDDEEELDAEPSGEEPSEEAPSEEAPSEEAPSDEAQSDGEPVGEAPPETETESVDVAEADADHDGGPADERADPVASAEATGEPLPDGSDGDESGKRAT